LQHAKSGFASFAANTAERCVDFFKMESLTGRAVRAAATASIVMGLSLITQQADAKDYVVPALLVTSPPISAALIAQRNLAALRLQPNVDSGQATTGPGGFIGFEMHYPNEIRDSAPAFAASAEVGAARTINGTVNGDITWHETREWTIAPDGPSDGDCKTYALTKEHDLRLQGLPDGTLRLVIVYTSHYPELHMILELRTVDGVYVLDSLTNDSGQTFYKMAAMPASYTVVKYQAWGRPEHWLTPDAPTPHYGAGGDAY
jgi:predicted transglutaminase-like cysteine proteinase